MQQEIFLTLRRYGPLRLTAIANKAGRSNSGVLYQLQKMEKDGVVVCTEEKLYRLADTEEIEKTILRTFLKKTLPIGEIFQADELKSYEQDKVEALSNKLIITGLLERVTGWSSEEGLHEVEKGYKLSFLGCRELEVCYFCNEAVNEGVAIEGIISEEISGGPTVDYGLRLHPACIAKWIESDYWREGDHYVQGASCDFCGLPTNANNLVSMIGYRNGIELSELKSYLSSEEEQAMSWRPKPKDGWETVSAISTESRLIEDRSDIEEAVSEIAERAEEGKINLGEHDRQKRTDQLWAIAAKLIEQNQSKWDILLKLCGPLLEPISVIYSQLPTSWAHHLRRYEIFTSKDSETGEERQETTSTSFLDGAHAPVMVHHGKQYHFYCYGLAIKFGFLSVKPGLVLPESHG
jgi:DNA-binding Lrp family transcriptional regulator